MNGLSFHHTYLNSITLKWKNIIFVVGFCNTVIKEKLNFSIEEAFVEFLSQNIRINTNQEGKQRPEFSY